MRSLLMTARGRYCRDRARRLPAQTAQPVPGPQSAPAQRAPTSNERDDDSGAPPAPRAHPPRCYNRRGWACSTAVSGRGLIDEVPSRGNARSGREEFREPFGM